MSFETKIDYKPYSKIIEQAIIKTSELNYFKFVITDEIEIIDDKLVPYHLMKMYYYDDLTMIGELLLQELRIEDAKSFLSIFNTMTRQLMRRDDE